MCRRRGFCNWCVLFFALGLLFGRCVDSWFLCGGLVAVCFFLPMLRRR